MSNGGIKIKQKLINILVQAIKEITNISLSPEDIALDIPKTKGHGDFSSNIAMQLARRANMNSKELGDKIKNEIINKHDFIKNIRVMEPGFINFYLKEDKLIKENLKSVENGDFKILKLGKRNVKVSIVLSKLSDVLKLQSFRAFMNMYYLGRIYSFAGFEVRKLVFVKDYDNDLNIRYLLSNFKDIEIVLNKEELKDSITFCSTLDQSISKDIDYKRFIIEGVNVYKNGLEINEPDLSELFEKIGFHRTKYTFSSKAIAGEMNIELTKDRLRYIIYPYSRVTSIINIFKDKVIDINKIEDFKEELLTSQLELEMLKKISGFKDAILEAINQNQPYKLIKYTNELCEIFYKINASTLYRKLSTERLVVLLKLLNSFRIVLKEILDILELPDYEKM